MVWLIGLGFLVYGYVQFFIARHLAKQIRNWPTTIGRIEACDLKRIDKGSVDFSELNLQYIYQVDNTQYANSRIMPGLGSQARTGMLDDVYTKLLSSEFVLVRYDPTNPQSSCLALGVGPMAYRHITIAVFMTAVLGVMLTIPHFNNWIPLFLIIIAIAVLFVLPIFLNACGVGFSNDSQMLRTISMCDQDGRLL